MYPYDNFKSEFGENYSPIDSNLQLSPEIDSDSPKQSPMRRKNKQRIGGVQQKHKRNEKKISFRLKYQIEW